MNNKYMTVEQAIALGETLRAQRDSLGLSAREVARRAEIDVGTVSRIEQGLIRSPRPESLVAIARVLELTNEDLFAFTDWFSTRALPAFTPYLRSKYGDLPPEALSELEGFFDYLRNKHGLNGPKDYEDEH